MLPKKNRITRKEFPTFQKGQGIRVFSDIFTGTLYPNSKNSAQVSVVVSKKVSKLATTRNSLRRKFYGAIEPILPRVKGSFLVVLYPKPEAIQKDLKYISYELEKSLAKAGVIA